MTLFNYKVIIPIVIKNILILIDPPIDPIHIYRITTIYKYKRGNGGNTIHIIYIYQSRGHKPRRETQ